MHNAKNDRVYLSFHHAHNGHDVKYRVEAVPTVVPVRQLRERDGDVYWTIYGSEHLDIKIQ